MRSSSFTMLLIAVLLIIIILALMIIIGLAIMLNTGQPSAGETNAIYEFISWLGEYFNEVIGIIVEWLEYGIGQIEKLSQTI